MILGIILIGFIAGLGQFLYYCRAAIASARDVDVSQAVQDVTSIGRGSPKADDFGRLLQFVGLCPDFRTHRMEIRAIQDYYNLLRGLGAVTRRFAPKIAAWSRSERAGCSHFAAVMLERRIALSRAMAAQRVAD